MELSHLQLPRGVGIGNWVIGNWELGIGNWESKIEYRLRVRNRVSINLWFSPTVSEKKPGFCGCQKPGFYQSLVFSNSL